MTTPAAWAVDPASDHTPTTRPHGHRGQPRQRAGGRRHHGHGHRHQLDRRHGRRLRTRPRAPQSAASPPPASWSPLRRGPATCDVTVTTPNGTSALNAPSDQFTYNGPRSDGHRGQPDSTDPGRWELVIVEWTNLTGATAVDFGTTNSGHPWLSGVTATSLTVQAASGRVTWHGATSPSSTPNGTSDVTGTSDEYTYNPAPHGHRGQPETTGRRAGQHASRSPAPGSSRARLRSTSARARAPRSTWPAVPPHGRRPGGDRHGARSP